MTPDSWTLIGTAIVVLIAIATSNRSIRREFSEIRLELRRLCEGEAALGERISQFEATLNERIGQFEATLD